MSPHQPSSYMDNVRCFAPKNPLHQRQPLARRTSPNFSKQFPKADQLVNHLNRYPSLHLTCSAFSVIIHYFYRKRKEKGCSTYFLTCYRGLWSISKEISGTCKKANAPAVVLDACLSNVVHEQAQHPSLIWNANSPPWWSSLVNFTVENCIFHIRCLKLAFYETTYVQHIWKYKNTCKRRCTASICTLGGCVTV